MKVSAATLLLGLGIGLAEGCTNILVSKGASRDGSTQVSALLQPVYFLSVFHFLTYFSNLLSFFFWIYNANC